MILEKKVTSLYPPTRTADFPPAGASIIYNVPQQNRNAPGAVQIWNIRQYTLCAHLSNCGVRCIVCIVYFIVVQRVNSVDSVSGRRSNRERFKFPNGAGRFTLAGTKTITAIPYGYGLVCARNIVRLAFFVRKYTRWPIRFGSIASDGSLYDRLSRTFIFSFHKSKSAKVITMYRSRWHIPNDFLFARESVARFTIE